MNALSHSIMVKAFAKNCTATGAEGIPLMSIKEKTLRNLHIQQLTYTELRDVT